MTDPVAPQTVQTWGLVLGHLLEGRDLDRLQAEWAMEQVMSGAATPGQIGAFLAGLRAKGEASSEIAVFVEIMLRHALPVHLPGAVDTCGTGGDGAGTVNISTMAAVVVAACGLPVVKHGNRAASSLSGSADVLEALGIAVTLAPDAVADCVRRTGIGFCFAPAFHPAMRFAGPVRRELGVPTVFNILGPLANPARPSAQLMGVANPVLAPVVAEALAERGTSALVVRGLDGLDEISTAAPTQVWQVADGAVERLEIDVLDLGIGRPPHAALTGGDAAVNAEIAARVLSGAPSRDADDAAVLDSIVVNAAAAVVAAQARGTASGAAVPLLPRLAAACERTRAAVASGAAARVLDNWRIVSQELAG